jgi:hypothetical protein
VAALSLLGSCVVAGVIGHLTPIPSSSAGAGPSIRTSSHRLVDPYLVGNLGTKAHTLDPETGALDPLILPGGPTLFQASYSPHGEDVQDGTEMGGVLLDPSTGEYSLARIRQSSGEVLGSVSPTVIPAGPVCWDPESPARVLFGSADGKLYCTSVEYDQHSTPAQEQRPIQWSGKLSLPSDILVQDACWPVDHRLAGRVLISVRFRRKTGDRLELDPARIWCLRLDNERTTVIEAAPLEPASRAAPASDNDVQERYPSLGSTADGQLLLAFQTYRRGRATGELRVTPLRIDPQSGAISARTSSATCLLDGCVRMAPSFSRNGRRVSCLTRKNGGSARVRTVDIAPILEASAVQASLTAQMN